MRFSCTFLVIALLFASSVVAQPPGPPPGGPGGPPRGPGGPGGRRPALTAQELAAKSIERLMKFDANGDGQLSKDELSDPRLAALFAAADADKNGMLSKDEITKWANKEAAAATANVGRGGPPSGGGPNPRKPSGGPPPR